MDGYYIQWDTLWCDELHVLVSWRGTSEILLKKFETNQSYDHILSVPTTHS